MGIVFGHVFNSKLNTWVYSFHVPLFFIVSGVVNNDENKSFKDIVTKNFKSLMIPYFGFSVLHIIYKMIIGGIDTVKLNILKTVTLFGVDALWFLPALFLSILCFTLINKNVEMNWIKVIVYTSIYVIPFIVRSENIIMVMILRTCTALGFIAFGNYISSWIKNKDFSIISIFILLIINVLIAYKNGLVDLYGLTFYNPCYYIIGSISGFLFLIGTFKKVKIRLKVLDQIGRNTLIIMATHQICTSLSHIITKNEAIIFIITIILEIPIIYIVNRYMPWIIGKFSNKQKLQQLTT